MITYNQSLVKKYRDLGLLIDSNLLLLFFIGVYDRKLIERFKRTRDRFVEQDFDILIRFLRLFIRRVTLPHILTEVSNLSAQLPEASQASYFLTFRRLTSGLEETHVPAIQALADPEFLPLGISDAAISVAAKSPFLVLTDDFKLFGKLQKAGVDTVNFNHLRTMS